VSTDIDPKKRILFVDDDPSLLEGLKNVLHRDRKRWDMTFALGGEAALEQIGANRFDIVVCDMRMPVVDGAALLSVVKRHAPATLRVMLSGSDCDAIMGEVDELLVKPCSAVLLRATIERLLAG
jgi:DNA-binding NtrC family response regulator